METIIQFGDVFRFREKDYVFLAQTEDTVFAALVLSREDTATAQAMLEKVRRNEERQKSAMYSFVVLKTTEFEGRAAHFARTGNTEHQTYIFDRIGKLDSGDCVQIRNEILSETSPVSIKLIELISDLNIKEE